MAENTIDSLYIEITSDSSMATKAIGKLISSLKVLKKEIGGGFSTSGFDTAVKSLDKIGAKTKDLAKNVDMSKLSSNLKKAADLNIDTNKLEQAIRQSRRASVVLGNLKEEAKEVSNVKIEPKIKLPKLEDVNKLVKEAQDKYNALSDELAMKQKVASEMPGRTGSRASVQLPIKQLEKEVEEARAILDNYQKMLQDATLREDEKKQGIEKFKESLKGLDFKTGLKIPDTFKELQKVIASTEKQLDNFRNKTREGVFIGSIEEGSDKWKSLYYNIEKSTQELGAYKNKLQEVQAEQEKTADDSTVNKSISAIVSFSTLSKYIGQFSKTLDRLSGKMSGVLVNLYAPLRHMVAEYKSKLGDIGNIFKTLGNVVEKAANKIRVKWNNLVHSFSKMVMRRALYAVLQTINDAMGSLANFAGVTGQKFNAAMSDMTANARYAGANIVAAFSPLVNAIAPMIDALVAKMVSAITVINQFFAALTGNNVYVKVKKTVTDYADSVKKAEKAQKDLVLGIDELNINNPNKNDAGSAAGEGAEFEWEEAPVLKKIKDFADKVKDIFGKLFDPLKKAWDRAGEYVISGFKYMVGELGKLAAAIGEDFLTMWQEEATVRIFENILGIVGDIEYTIGNLARNFREAWKENDTGLDIFRNMRDILGILVEHVRNVTQAMKDWSKTVDFRPMLTSFRDMLESLKPVADFIGGVFEDVMNNVVIRYIDWMISDGIPHLNNTIASIADAFDWEKMRSDMVPVEEAFGNLAIAIHEGTVNALGNLGQALAKITNTETFTKFMENIARIINLVDAELVEKVLTALGNCILDIAGALVEFVGSDKFTDFLGDVKKYLDDLTVEDIEGIIKGLAISIGLFKFGAFVGEGVANAIKFLSTASSLAGTGGIGTLASSLAGLAEGAVILGGVVLHIKALTDNLKDLRNAIKNKDVPGAIQSVVEAIWRILNPAASAGIEIWELILKTTGLGDKIKETWEKIKTTLAPVKEWIKTNITEPVGRAFSTLWENVKEIWGKVSGWFDEKVIQPVVSFFEGFKKRVNQIFEGLWILVKAVWIVASGWFKENVIEPVSEKFNDIKTNVTKAFQDAWDKVCEIWDGISTWFSDNVIEPFIEVFNPIAEKISEIFSGVWEGIKEGAAGCFNGVIEMIEGVINGVVDRINDWLSVFNALVERAASIANLDWGGVDLLDHISLGRVEWKASGGFLGSPSSYSLFGMGENGVPEILGTVGGKSAVAGGEEITGIRDQVYESGLAEQVLLGQAISLLQVIADKDFNVDLDGRSMVTALQSRSTRNGYSMATVS